MSTNYYLRHKPTDEQIRDLKTLIDMSRDGSSFTTILEMVNTMYREPDEYDIRLDFGVLHLGKRSAGWKFQWCPNIIKKNCSFTDRNGNYVTRYEYAYRYPLTKQGVRDFIMDDAHVVVNEYNEIIDKEKFLEMAFNWCPDGMDSTKFTCSTSSSSVRFDMSDNQEKFKQLGYEFNDIYQTDFENDGLRWMVFDNFS